MGEGKLPWEEAGFRTLENLVMDGASLSMEGPWVETLSRRLHWSLGTENKALNIVSPWAAVENVGTANN